MEATLNHWAPLIDQSDETNSSSIEFDQGIEAAVGQIEIPKKLSTVYTILRGSKK